MQDPELLAEMNALMGGDAPQPAKPKPPTQQELVAQFQQHRQRAIALKKQGNLTEAKKAVRVRNRRARVSICRSYWLQHGSY